MSARALAGAGLVAAAAALGVWWAVDPVPGTSSRVAREPLAPPESPASPARAAKPPMPASLRETDVDGAWSLDAAARFLPSPAVLRRFDYFLSASGEEPLAVSRARIEGDLRARLVPRNAAAALDLLDRYLAYREAARDLDAAGIGSLDLETRLQRIRELRRAHFGEDTARLLFDEEDRLAEVTLARARVEADPDLDPAERARRQEALEAELPEAVARARAEARAPLELAREEAALREEGATADEIRHLRASRFGHEAAERLVALDAARADWSRRFNAYRALRDALLAGDGASRAELEALRADRFAPHELPRVRGLDRIDGVAEDPLP